MIPYSPPLFSLKSFSMNIILVDLGPPPNVSLIPQDNFKKLQLFIVYIFIFLVHSTWKVKDPFFKDNHH